MCVSAGGGANRWAVVCGWPQTLASAAAVLQWPRSGYQAAQA